MEKSFARQKWEISITLVIYGTLVLVLGWFLKNSDAAALNKPLPQLATSAGLFLGRILLITAAVLLGSGVCLAVSGRKFWALLGATAASSILVVAALPSLLTGRIVLAPILLGLLVLMLWFRVFAFLNTTQPIPLPVSPQNNNTDPDDLDPYQDGLGDSERMRMDRPD